ncbi:MAG: sodium:alanine symporter family protein, partial [Leptospiraceae bacterium]|nr:sodium:alanine symporter family protein [Leptospiraceae bacterium]
MSDLIQYVIAMEQQLLRTLDSLSGIIWGLPLCVLLIGTGLFLTFRLRGIQITHFSYALYLALIKRKESDGEDSAGEISHFQALMTALSATVGTGNIVGVATAIGMGGPGALFWMWVTGLVGMATKYTEAVLAVHYRETDDRGEMVGGPMYYLRKGISGPAGRVLAFLFAVFAVVASFGIGNLTQANSVADALQGTFELDRWITALILVLLSALVILGGIRWIGKVTSVLVPIMIVFYMTGALIIFFIYIDGVPAAFKLILERAFAPDAAGGGFIGVMISRAVEYGVKRGVFSNESGLGSSPI